MVNRRVAVAALALSGCGLLAERAAAQSALAEVSILSSGNVPTLTFPGVGPSTFKFASGSKTDGSGSANGTASAGQGSITAFAAAGDFGGRGGSIISMATHSSASMSDTIRITTSAGSPTTFSFSVGASGGVSAVRAGSTSVSGTSSASVEWSASLGGAGSSASGAGSVGMSYTIQVINGVAQRVVSNTQTGAGFGSVALTVTVPGDGRSHSFSMSMSALAKAGYNIGPTGSTMSGVADFGSTLRWLGLTSVTNPDGSAYTGTFQVSSDSGFDYTTPTPGAAGLLGAGMVWAGRRRRAG
jgi:MYXO-CTERM domain-containing protein